MLSWGITRLGVPQRANSVPCSPVPLGLSPPPFFHKNKASFADKLVAVALLSQLPVDWPALVDCDLLLGQLPTVVYSNVTLPSGVTWSGLHPPHLARDTVGYHLFSPGHFL